MPMTEKQLANLKPNVFGKDNQPAIYNGGRPKGSRNRKNVIQDMLDLITEVELPDGNKIRGTIQDKMVASMVREANNGNVQAFTVLMDGLHGKVPNVQINDNKPPVRIDYKKFSPEQLEQLQLLLAHGMTTDNGHIQEAEVVE